MKLEEPQNRIQVLCVCYSIVRNQCTVQDTQGVVSSLSLPRLSCQTGKPLDRDWPVTVLIMLSAIIQIWAISPPT